MPAQAVLPGPGSRRAAETAAWLRACLHPPASSVNERFVNEVAFYVTGHIH